MAALCHTCVVLWGVVHKPNAIFPSLPHLKVQATVNMLMVFLLVLAL